MTPITRTAQSATARRRGIAHRAAEGTITAYLRDVSAAGRREPMPAPPRVRAPRTRSSRSPG
ncbi:hypothetical protein DSM112329_04175 [Paraconexibacter sp. AEG42_29]|uniref:Uncharacterized protein n=1 Tax=Paraconexibacter sp. AEG42_29 TaxID=2997339 RepID=A0AAU7B134_9ACTN